MSASKLIRRPVSVATLLIGTLVAVGTATAAPAASAPYCGITWGSTAKSGGVASENPLSTTRTGRHECFDRLVFEFAGPANGYTVEYASEIRADGSGQLVSVAGGAKLRVVLEANVFDRLGHLHYSARTGQHVNNVAGYDTLRDVVYAGCFEGATTFGVGVRARLPFRVFTLAGPGTHSRIVLDVAHRW